MTSPAKPAAELVREYAELEGRLADPAIHSDQGLARRLGRRTMVLTPNTAVQAQWLRAWADFGGTGEHPVPAGTSPDLRAAVTVLTYQALSAWDRGADDQDVEDSTDGALAERRRARQIAGLESVGRALAAGGPTPQLLERVVDVITQRFGYALVSVHLAVDGRLELGAQRGYETSLDAYDGSAGIMSRALRTGKVILVPDVAADPDYVTTDAGILSEIVAPLVAALGEDGFSVDVGHLAIFGTCADCSAAGP